MTLEEMRARRAAIEAELRGINEAAGDAALTDEQATRWTSLESEHVTLGEGIEREERSARIAESRARWGTVQMGVKEDPFDGSDVRSLPRAEARSKALAVLEQRENTYHLENLSGTQARVDRLVRTQSNNFNGDQFARYMLASESEAYRSAFMKLIGGGAPVLTAEEGRAVNLVNELRAAMSLTAANGGYGVPVLIDPTIILTAQGHPNDFFDIARVEDITTSTWNGVSSAGATSYWATEGITVTGGEPTLAQPTVPTKKLTTYVKYSFEVGGDYPNFASEMANVMGSAHQEALVSAFTIGLGTTAQPTGISTSLKATSASQVLVSTDGSLYAADLYKLWAALPIRYRGAARWMASTSVLNAVRQFAAGSNNSDANFTVSVGQETVDRLFGKPVHYNDYMDPAVGTNGATSASSLGLVIVGDFRNFLIANRVGATVETVQHVLDTTTGNPTGQRGTLMWARIGSNVINSSGFRLLTQA